MPDVKVFHAGTDPARPTRRSAATAGSSPTAAASSTSPRWATTLAEAQARAYEAVRAIRFTGAWYRRDIANRALRRGPAVTPCRTRIGIARGPTLPGAPSPFERHGRDEARPLGGDGPRALPGRARPGRGSIRDDAVVCVHAFCDAYFGCFEVEVLRGPLGTEAPVDRRGRDGRAHSIWPR